MNKFNSNIKSVLIIANGKTPKKELLNRLAEESDCIIAADGGCNICFKNNIYPDYIIGDFDSINNNIKAHFKDAEIIYLPDQNEHDLLKALTFCETLQPESVVVAAAFGKRIDHTLSNLFILQKQKFNFLIEFIDDYGKVFILNNTLNLKMPISHPVSLISFSPVFGITLKGFKYQLKCKDFPDGFNGVSNEIATIPSKISVKKGSLIAIIPHE